MIHMWAFYEEGSTWMNEWGKVGFVYPDFSKAFDAVSKVRMVDWMSGQLDGLGTG